MVGVIVLIASFVVAILGFVHSHAADSKAPSVLGFTRIGAAMVVVATLGFVFGVVQQIQSARSEAERTEMLKAVYSKVIGEAENASPETAATLRELGSRIQAIASISRESDFAMSDFARSNFAKARFTGANFELSEFSGANFDESLFRNARFVDAIFTGSDFSGADLRGIIVSAHTKLPEN